MPDTGDKLFTRFITLERHVSWTLFSWLKVQMKNYWYFNFVMGEGERGGGEGKREYQGKKKQFRILLTEHYGDQLMNSTYITFGILFTLIYIVCELQILHFSQYVRLFLSTYDIFLWHTKRVINWSIQQCKLTQFFFCMITNIQNNMWIIEKLQSTRYMYSTVGGRHQG